MSAKTNAYSSNFIVMDDVPMVRMNGEIKCQAVGTRVSDLFRIWGPRAYLLKREGLVKNVLDDPAHVLSSGCVYELNFRPKGSVKNTLLTAWLSHPTKLVTVVKAKSIRGKFKDYVAQSRNAKCSYKRIEKAITVDSMEKEKKTH